MIAICQAHWDRIRKALEERGIGHLGAKSGQAAIAAVVTELEGRGDENEFDPLMGCNNMIWTKGLEVCGLDLMTGEERKCPICEAIRRYETWWIDGPANSMLEVAKEKGLA